MPLSNSSTASRWAVAAGLAALSLTAVAQQPQQTTSAGQRFYEKTCAKCHETGIGPVIRGRGLTPEVVTFFARTGVNAMPAFRVTDIDDATLHDVGVYLSNSQPPAAAKP